VTTSRRPTRGASTGRRTSGTEAHLAPVPRSNATRAVMLWSTADAGDRRTSAGDAPRPSARRVRFLAPSRRRRATTASVARIRRRGPSPTCRRTAPRGGRTGSAGDVPARTASSSSRTTWAHSRAGGAPPASASLASSSPTWLSKEVSGDVVGGSVAASASPASRGNARDAGLDALARRVPGQRRRRYRPGPPPRK